MGRNNTERMESGEGESIGMERMERIVRLNSELFSGVESLEVPMRFFEIGVEYLKTGNKKVLLRLPAEERKFLTGIIGVEF